MTSRIAFIAIDARDPLALADFWCRVLDWTIAKDRGDVVGIAPADSSWPRVDFRAVPEPKTVKNRIHLDLGAPDSSPEEELRRLTELGASQVEVGQSGDEPFVVLADPEGNEFCLVTSPIEGL